MINTYILEFLDDLNYVNIDISSLVFKFYTSDDELGTIQTDEYGENKND